MDTLTLMWPDRTPWPRDAARRCYRLLADTEQDIVYTALERLKGDHPPSPSSLEAEVSKVLANVYQPAKALPEPATRPASVVGWLRKVGAASVREHWRNTRETTDE